MVTGSLLIALLFLGVGVIAGALVALLIAWGLRKKPAPTADSRAALYRSEARLWRDRKSSHLVVEVDGRMFPSPARLDDAQRVKVGNLLTELQSWMGVKAPAPILPAAVPSSAPAPLRAESHPAVPGPAAAPASITPPSPAVASKAPARLSIVEQIDAVLQEKIAGTPLAERTVHISEGPHQTVVVWIGALRHDGIDAVPDPEVKAAIRAAVAEWERRAEKNSPSGQ